MAGEAWKACVEEGRWPMVAGRRCVMSFSPVLQRQEDKRKMRLFAGMDGAGFLMLFSMYVGMYVKWHAQSTLPCMPKV